MDLSPIIFVVLVLAWAVYLIPKALSHHDEVASDQLEEGHTDDVRILSRTKRVTTSVAGPTESVATEAPAGPVVETAAPAEVVVEETVTSVTATHEEHTARPTPRPAARPAPRPAALPTRASARRAARNRRRVLSVLVALTAVVTGVVVAGRLPSWTVAIPAGMVVAFLVLARSSVRRMQRLHADAAPAPFPATRAAAAAAREAAPARRETPTAAPASAPAGDVSVEDALAELGTDPSPERRVEVETALSDNGSLWDPLPLTLPTYVGKAQARRTVRTIELTGITSSGHDAADSAVAREAEAEAAEEATTERVHSKVVGG